MSHFFPIICNRKRPLTPTTGVNDQLAIHSRFKKKQNPFVITTEPLNTPPFNLYSEKKINFKMMSGLIFPNLLKLVGWRLWFGAYTRLLL